MTDHALPSLQVLATGGEAPAQEILAHFAKQVKLINAYGPTEASVTSNMHVVKPGDAANNIGKANGNYKLYVLNEHNVPVPQGAIGECASTKLALPEAT